MTDAFSAKQIAFLRESSARVNFTEGSIRSGKTVVTLVRWLIYIAKAPYGGELVMVGRTRDAVWRNCIAPLQNPELFGPSSAQVVGNYGAPTVKILGRVVHVLGASDVKAEKVIRGMTVAGAYVDEATTLPEEFFTQLLGRMSVPGAKMFVSTNPDNPAHFLKAKYLDRLDLLPDWKAWHFTLEDNPSLTESYKASVCSEFTGLWYRRFISGEWVAAEGAVFDMWDDEKHIVPWAELPPMEQLISVGVDYGTSNATAAILIGLGIDGIMYAVDEWTWDAKITQRNLTNGELADQLLAWLDEEHTPDGSGGQPRFTVVDPSALSFRTELSAQGHASTTADNDVKYGLRSLMSMLAEGQYRISDRCRALIKEIPGYSWDPKAAEQGEDKPIKVADHCLVAGTRVSTARGRVPIEDVEIGDVVLTRRGYRHVTDAWQSSPGAEVMTIITAEARKLTGTPDHRVWTARGWTRMGDLEPHDQLCVPYPGIDSVAAVSGIHGKAAVYDLTVDGEHEFFANGILVHNCIDAWRYATITTEQFWIHKLSRGEHAAAG